MPVNAAADHYLREFGLPASVAQMVMQRVQARVAADELTAQYDDALPPRLEGGRRPSSGARRSPSPPPDGVWPPGRSASELEPGRQVEVGGAPVPPPAEP